MKANSRQPDSRVPRPDHSLGAARAPALIHVVLAGPSIGHGAPQSPSWADIVAADQPIPTRWPTSPATELATAGTASAPALPNAAPEPLPVHAPPAAPGHERHGPATDCAGHGAEQCAECCSPEPASTRRHARSRRRRTASSGGWTATSRADPSDRSKLDADSEARGHWPERGALDHDYQQHECDDPDSRRPAAHPPPTVPASAWLPSACAALACSA